jgi:hypothetical protein
MGSQTPESRFECVQPAFVVMARKNRGQGPGSDKDSIEFDGYRGHINLCSTGSLLDSELVDGCCEPEKRQVAGMPGARRIGRIDP